MTFVQVSAGLLGNRRVTGRPGEALHLSLLVRPKLVRGESMPAESLLAVEVPDDILHLCCRLLSIVNCHEREHKESSEDCIE